MKTTKLDLAAALISHGAGLEKVDRSDPRHMEFHLIFSGPYAPEDEWFKARVALWEKRELLVNVRDYVDAQQKLKSEVHK